MTMTHTEAVDKQRRLERKPTTWRLTNDSNGSEWLFDHESFGVMLAALKAHDKAQRANRESRQLNYKRAPVRYVRASHDNSAGATYVRGHWRNIKKYVTTESWLSFAMHVARAVIAVGGIWLVCAVWG